MIDPNDLENLCNKLETKILSSNATNVGATAGKANRVSSEHLSKIWCIDIDTA